MHSEIATIVASIHSFNDKAAYTKSPAIIEAPPIESEVLSVGMVKLTLTKKQLACSLARLRSSFRSTNTNGPFSASKPVLLPLLIRVSPSSLLPFSRPRLNAPRPGAFSLPSAGFEPRPVGFSNTGCAMNSFLCWA